MGFVRSFELLRIIEKGVGSWEELPAKSPFLEFFLNEKLVPLSPAVQQGVQLTVGGPRVFQPFSWLWFFPVSPATPHPHPPPLTPKPLGGGNKMLEARLQGMKSGSSCQRTRRAARV